MEEYKEQEIIRLEQVTKRFGRNVVLEGIDLSIKRGESIALLGNNGTGKSTLLRLISGLSNVSSGEMIHSGALKFNYVPEHFPKMNITVDQYIRHMGLIEGVSPSVIDQRSKELYQAYYMEGMIDIPMKNLSKGTLQKTAVIQALVTRPDVMLLDEPLSGQDIRSQNTFIAMMRELKRQGVTIIMSCHEKFLVNRISDTAYEIIKHKLKPVSIDSVPESEYDLLVFEPEDRKLCGELMDMVERVEKKDGEIRMIVPRDKSNEVLIRMLQNKFILRLMKGIEE